DTGYGYGLPRELRTDQPVQYPVTSRSLGRSGLTLVELLVALTVTTIAGAALIQVMLAQNRASGTNEAWRVARAVSRGSLNRLLADLRVAEAEGALDALTVDGKNITLRVPY